MTFWEKRILDLLAERYPSAAAASGGRALRLRPDMSFPEFAGSGADETESFLEAAEKLEHEGIISLAWERHRRGEVLKSFALENPALLFARLGRASPVTVLEEARVAARGEAERIAPDFFRWLAGNLRAEDAASGIDAALVHALGQLSGTLSGGAAGVPVSMMTPRALSVGLYSDSKYLENLLYRTRFLLQRAEAEGIAIPDFSVLERSFPETMLAGRFLLEFTDALPLGNDTGMIVGLPAASARLVQAVSLLPRTGDSSAVESSALGRRPTLLSVENKETFYALSSAMQSGKMQSGKVPSGDVQSGGLSGFDCLLYTAGHPNQAVCVMLGVFARSGFRFFHAGDLDLDGILILQEVMRASGRPVQPFGMDAFVFDRYLPFARDLTPGMLSRFLQIADETRSLSGIEALVERILSTGKGVEQEIIDYSGLSTGTSVFPQHREERTERVP